MMMNQPNIRMIVRAVTAVVVVVVTTVLVGDAHATFDISLQCPTTTAIPPDVMDTCVEAALSMQLGATSVSFLSPTSNRRNTKVVMTDNEVDDDDDEEDIVHDEHSSPSSSSDRQLQNLCVYYQCSTSAANEYWCDRLNCPGWRQRRQLMEVPISSTTLLTIELSLEDCITAAGGSYVGACTAEILVAT
jgi:hypothetical protein